MHTTNRPLISARAQTIATPVRTLAHYGTGCRVKLIGVLPAAAAAYYRTVNATLDDLAADQAVIHVEVQPHPAAEELADLAPEHRARVTQLTSNLEHELRSYTHIGLALAREALTLRPEWSQHGVNLIEAAAELGGSSGQAEPGNMPAPIGQPLLDLPTVMLRGLAAEVDRYTRVDDNPGALPEPARLLAALREEAAFQAFTSALDERTDAEHVLVQRTGDLRAVSDRLVELGYTIVGDDDWITAVTIPQIHQQREGAPSSPDATGERPTRQPVATPSRT